MTESDQVRRVMAYQHELQLKADRGALPPEDIDGPSAGGWAYGDETGPNTHTDPQANESHWSHSRADDTQLAQFVVGSREVVCSACWLIHRPDQECP